VHGGDTQSFIVRIWHEGVDATGNIVAWRGSIDHVGSGRRVYFHDLNGALRFIQDQAGVRVSRDPWWRAVLAWVRHETA